MNHECELITSRDCLRKELKTEIRYSTGGQGYRKVSEKLTILNKLKSRDRVKSPRGKYTEWEKGTGLNSGKCIHLRGEKKNKKICQRSERKNWGYSVQELTKKVSVK